MSALPLLAPLALAAIQRELILLQQLATQPEHAALREPVAQLAGLCESVEDVVSGGICRLSGTSETLQGLLDLLRHAEDRPLPANRVAGLLAPLQQQVVHACSEIGQIL
ncbi:DUF1484 family protein [Chromobacterium violaceum]|uniref:DUF1484 domain-containing protein n=1 Tax=Chromobacterium violaceum (strain ATCC 12472 / DSM 30191 / JCM 1249 / CCUG 213 / NBRC 12614 / NCIMB 9131 / NCTC 9757 / MK) TaxID=243365 RepID=Q7P0C5_CHRVO|nr:DUF1484 family protein [Chromobacterium violaceum]AAQ58318.1 hypothetical protein CV_0642 [Chromobacterium violaceum ATCC 12472]SUX40099.1 Protein of uncharacterised function (DUF1484) [Chromobacterium violaceum]